MPDDIAERSPQDVYGLALAHFNFARQRTAGSTKVNVYNPEFDVHGWQSRHTAVEIVTDDMPFLIDSVSMELDRRGFGVHLIIHPVLIVRRDAEGELLEVLLPTPEPPEDALAESVIHAEVKRQTHPAELEALRDHLLRVIGEVSAAVEDWPQMRRRALDIVDELQQSPAQLDEDEVAEVKAFLAWLAEDHFTFLGFREYELVREEEGLRLDSGELRAWNPAAARRHPDFAWLRQAPARGARPGARALPPQHHQGELALHRSPIRLPRLRGGEALRRRRTGGRRAALPRPLHPRGVPGEAG